jgi:hypothetical protein
MDVKFFASLEKLEGADFEMRNLQLIINNM